MKLEDVARKSIVSCVSDFAAKGVKPIFGIVSLTIPKKLSRSNIESLAKGFQRTAREFKLKILGGDTNEGKELVITFSLFGVSKKITGNNIKNPTPTSNERSYKQHDKFWCMPLPKNKHYKRFVDFQNDVAVSDIELAVREGFRSIEHVKRFTTLGMAKEKGKKST